MDDSSPDGTGELADRLAQDDPHVKVLHRPRKEGLGQAYLAGFELALLAGAELILEMDADFSHDPSYLPRMIEAAAEADLVLGSRYVPGGGTRNWGRLRSSVSRGGCWYARTVLGLPIRDLTGGFKCFRREVLEAVDLSRIRVSGICVPGRAHLPRSAAGLPGEGDPDRLHGPAGGPEQDVAQDRPGGDVDDPRAAEAARAQANASSNEVSRV